jgi:aspartate ammonia-lyase
MSEYRTERDLLGERAVPVDALHGIYTERAMENFPLSGRPVRPELIHAFGAVKLACCRTNQELGGWDERTFSAIERACAEMSEGLLDIHVRVDAFAGGSGTTANLCVNEVLANRALELLGERPGTYAVVDPLDDVNRHQSTNDTFPTSLKVAAIGMLRRLERELVGLMEAFHEKERQFAHVLKIGRTEYQDAVPLTLGREMGAYAEAFTRDRWRVYKCEERLRVVNLGGTAIGTGLGAPRQYIFRVVDHLKDVTGFGLSRAENLVDGTQNADVFVEVHGILKALAASLLKISTDLRLLSSGPEAGLGEIRLPPRQPGSSIMPGKVNPVIPEAVSQAAMFAMGQDQVLAHAASMGSLELNAFMPLIAECLLGSLSLLSNACSIFRSHCLEGLEADEGRCRRHVEGATAMVTALVEHIGYKAAQAAAQAAKAQGRTLREVVLEQGLMDEDAFDRATGVEAVNRLGVPQGRSVS